MHLDLRKLKHHLNEQEINYTGEAHTHTHIHKNTYTHIFIENEHGIIAVKDQKLQQNIMLQKYHKQKQTVYAASQQSEKTMDHMSACPILAQQQYIKTQDTVCAQNFNAGR
jgi:hypothetical protein